jgi:hypothetical protein
MENNTFNSERAIPIDNAGLQEMLKSGPSVPKSEVQRSIPPMPEANPINSNPASESPSDDSKEDPKQEKPDLENYLLPSEEMKQRLKSQYGELLVVPVPSKRDDGKVVVYILKSLTRSQWRAAEEQARKIAEAKPNVSPDEIFQEKIVSMAAVWPEIPEHKVSATKAGLIPTLFGIIQQQSLFFNPEALMTLTFTL